MSRIVRFSSYEADLDSGELRKRGLRIKLRDQSFKVLAALVESPGQLVTREDLRQRLWSDQIFVEFEKNLNTAVAHLREVLGDSADHPRYIETLPKRGYRFIADVYAPPAATAELERKRARLVVLPFLNLSGDPAQEYFSDAMTDEVITQLAGLAPEQLGVIARTTAMHYKGSHKDVTRIGRELGVDYVVEGCVHRSDDQVGINVQLIRVSDQAHLFARKYETPMPDLFSLYSRIAKTILDHIPTIDHVMHDRLSLLQDVQRKPTQNLAAYNEYIKGRYEMWRMTPESSAKAIRHLEAALTRDPELALACNALAELYWYMGLLGYVPSRETDLLGRSYAHRAVKLDSQSADAHVLLSFYPEKHNSPGEIDYYDWTQIQKRIAHARELDPNSRMVRVRYAMIQAVFGHTEAAAAELEHALDLDPLSFDLRSWLAMILYLGRRFDQALEQMLRNRDLEPEHFVSYYHLGYLYLGMQRFDESIAAFRKAVEISRELPHTLGTLGLSLGLGGQMLEARAVLDRLQALARQRYVPPTCFAWTYLGLRDTDEAFLWLERAVDAPDRMIEPIKTYPFLDPLRSNPRFTALLHKMNLGFGLEGSHGEPDAS